MSIRPVDIILDSTQAGTSDRVTGTTDAPVFNLFPAVEDCVGVSLIYANVPFTYYVIDSTNNKFTIQSADYGTAAACEIDPGTYNSINIGNQILDAIKRKNNAASTTQYVVYIDSTSGKLVWYDQTTTPLSGNTFQLDFSVIDSVGPTLGFNAAIYASSSQTFRDDTETAITKPVIFAPRVANLTGPSQMFLASDFGGAVYGSVRNQSSNQPLLGFWPVNSNYQGTIEYVRETPPVIPISRTNVSSIRLGLLIGNRTRYGVSGSSTATQEFLSLNGEGYQIGLRFHCLSTDLNLVNDSVGNSVMSSREDTTSNVYNPKKFQRNNVVSKRKY